MENKEFTTLAKITELSSMDVFGPMIVPVAVVTLGILCYSWAMSSD